MGSAAINNRTYFPQALASGLASRVNKDSDSALITTTVPTTRNRRQVNYSEYDRGEDDFDDDFSPSSTSNQQSNNQSNESAVNKIILKPVRVPKYPSDLDSEENLKEVKNSDDVLVPIRLSIDYNGGNSKYQDCFMWNLNQTLISPEEFASIAATDLELPTSVHSVMVESIKKQIEEYKQYSNLQLPSNMEYHVIINLAVSLGKILYEDRFEWDLTQTDVSPEMFADIVVADMGLSLEFKPAIATSLHEVISRLKREIIEGKNHELEKYQQLSGLIFERGIRISTESSVNNGNDHWEPIVEILTPEEITRREVERQRSSRRKNRENLKGVSGKRKFDEVESSWRSY
ncbi:Chromatin structure remodeling complex protein sfh1 [Yamadazyma tenuis]|uniref:SNF5-domain-containing protein n=1 Tax=Candida tenuis (strain ATCC 10573 / BCRC 21748 / CBS 615 / JCM 9827 / NBRC 10315 / NRRL Y-1498 / VKM Y-70) TaxID=590646 RepID=G3B1X7_CANTC|nr:uncharacterized protein CANTEDRAFT_113323 [Yamadazyma tenuis ATCC 10573]EGV64555.1 hypothetical protein CANTEDRAFT_113323 [Yamadazyma tenuis ATCC 10573]WEJ97318.1 Chromatin structure remodeling complex protein sfh1 [Yamadazyma tenuis]